jgi:hypothetical protein
MTNALGVWYCRRMPIRFACPRCRQKLSVSTRKAGTTADCPRCKASIQIPEPESAPSPESPQPGRAVRSFLVASPPAGGDDERAGQGSTATQPEEASPAASQVEVVLPSFDFGEETELVYDTTDDASYAAPAEEQPDLIAVPRWVLYLQGGLLAVVALASFAIGLIAGSTLSGGPSGPREPQACVIEGTINYAAGNRSLADEGAVVAVIPQNEQRPDEKAPAIGLRPEDSTPGENNRGVAILRELGGGYGRTDQRGRFQVRVPDRGKYLVLVISRSRQVQSLDEISTEDLLKLGPYFDNAADLLGRQRYQLTQEVVRGDRRLNVVFE